MRSSAIEATNGAVFAISTPVCRGVSQLGTGPRVEIPVEWEQANLLTSWKADRSGSSAPNNPLDSHQPVQNMLAQMKSWMKTIEEKLSRSPSVRSPKSSNSSSSSSPKGWG